MAVALINWAQLGYQCKKRISLFCERVSSTSKDKLPLEKKTPNQFILLIPVIT